ncbi:MAG: SIS domain-containing protein, partial [Candidatus Sericytochromatia bacterium]
MNAQDCLQRNLNASIEAKRASLSDSGLQSAFQAAVTAVLECIRHGHRLYIAGNGGSAADSQHLAAEFICRLSKDRAAMPAEALTVDTSVLTS